MTNYAEYTNHLRGPTPSDRNVGVVWGFRHGPCLRSGTTEERLRAMPDQGSAVG